MAVGLVIGLSLIDFYILILILRSALHLAKYSESMGFWFQLFSLSIEFF